MGDTTGIAWTERTWNPWHGCHKIAPECKFCYMFREKAQYGQNPNVVVRGKTTFNAPLRWKEPSLVFTCSWSDWFVEEADPWREEAYGIIRATPHTYQILTKRIERAASRWPGDLPNAWLGVSVGVFARKWQIDALKVNGSTASLRFLSLEPLLQDLGALDLSGIGWVIIGGESGPEHRMMEIPWLESIVSQCKIQRVPVFVKQDSNRKPGQKGRIPDEFWIRQMPERMVM